MRKLRRENSCGRNPLTPSNGSSCMVSATSWSNWITYRDSCVQLLPRQILAGGLINGPLRMVIWSWLHQRKQDLRKNRGLFADTKRRMGSSTNPCTLMNGPIQMTIIRFTSDITTLIGRVTGKIKIGADFPTSIPRPSPHKFRPFSILKRGLLPNEHIFNTFC